MDNIEKKLVYDKLNSVGFYDNIPTEDLKSSKMPNVQKVLPKAIANFRNLLLPAIESVEDPSEER